MRFVTPNKESTRRALRKVAAERIQYRCVLWKKRWAVWMENKYNRLSLKKKTIILLCFVTFTGGYSIFLVVSAFNNRQSLGHSATRFSIPRHIKTTVSNPIRNYAVHDEEYKRIHRFRLYMDSLYKDPSGRSLYDSIIRRRPGLMDSVFMAENILLRSENEKDR